MAQCSFLRNLLTGCFVLLTPLLAFAQSSPTISSISPGYGPVGTSVTINGSNFGATQGTSSLKFGTYVATPTSWTSSQIVTSVPTMPNGKVYVAVTVGGSSASTPFTVGNPPLLTGMSPGYGPQGTVITFTGHQFGATQGSSTVTLGSYTMTPTSWSDTQIVAPVPSNAPNGKYYPTISVGGLQNPSSAGPFTVGNPPLLTGMSPGYGPPGTVITFTGQGFGATQGSSTVTLGSYTMTPTSWSDTQIVAPVPSNAPNGKYYPTISVGGLQNPSSAGPFIVGNPPLLNGMSPGYGPQGTVITFTGQGFGATQGSSTVTLGTYAMTPTSWSDTQIVAPVPSNAPNGKYYPTITVGGLQDPTSAGPFIVGNPPLLTGMSPGYGPQGTVITLTGSAFGATQGSSTVTLGTYTMTPTSWSDTQIVAPVPSNAPNGKYYPTITVGGLQDPTSAGPFIVGNPPIISSLSPASGPPGVTITVTGVRFGATQGASVLKFGSYTATPTSWSDTQIIALVPSGMAPGKVYPDAVVAGLDTYSSPPFTVTQLPPAISALSPAAGTLGTVVTISGSGFGATQGSGTVTFNGVAATPSSWSDKSIVVGVPSGATTGNVVVTANGSPSNGQSFTIVSIVALTPAAAPAGASVTITGSGFGAIQQDVSTVSFNGTTAVAISWSDTKVIAVVSNSTTSGPVSVTVGGVTSNSLNFTATAAPSITSVSPNTGAAGTQVSITGSGFGSVQGSGTVQLGSRAGTVVSWSDSSVVATVATGSVSGTAQVRQAGVGSNSVAFTVITATITSVSPSSGAAGTQVTISGSGFGSAQGAGQVWLGTASAQVSSWGDSQVVATVASGSNSGTAQILQNGVWSNPVAFTVTGGAPHITSINPNQGGGGTVVTILGTGFGSSQGSGIAWIGAQQASVNSWSDTQVSATVAGSAVSGVAKIQQNGLGSNAVTYTVPVTLGSGSSQVTLNPNVLGMVVGDTRSIQALGSNSQPVTGLTWMSSDSTIVTLSADDPPLITAVAPGNATITAGSASADVTVYSGSKLPVGTVIWSNPGDGSGVRSISPAVASTTGAADVFALQGDGTLQAITSDGALAWATALPNTDTYPIPDFQGGAITTDTKSVFRFDGLTGQLSTVYTPSFDVPDEVNILGVHTDGTIFATELTCSGNANQDASVCTAPNASSNNATGLLIVGLDPGTATAKFKVPTDLITVDGSTSDASFCPVGPTSTPPETPSSAIAGDGYAYFVYYTFHEFDRLSPAAVLPYPKQAYLDLDLLYNDTANSKFGAAIGDQQALWGDLQLGAVPPDDRLLVALQAGDQFTALSIETGLPPGLGHPCSSSTTFTTQVHFLRVGTKGDSSDVVVKQWTETEQRVALPTVNYPFDHTTTRSGSMPALDWAYIITNSDQGVVVSWTIGTDNYCAQETVSNGQSTCAAYVDTRFEAHLTTMTGGSIAGDAAWGDDRFIQPLLQLSDGSFVGNSDDGMANFDAAGNVKWDVPGYSPQMATADGSVIASNGGNATTFDGATGLATGQVPSLPTFSWKAAYQDGDVQSVAVPAPTLATTFAAVNGGNFTGDGTATVTHSFGLFWCGIGYALQGYVPGSPCLQNNGNDIRWGYYPVQSGISSLRDFSVDHPEWVGIIEREALNSFKAAFAKYPIQVQLAGQTPTCLGSFCSTTSKPDQDYTAYILGNYPYPTAGQRFIGTNDSGVYYFYFMENAQIALGQPPNPQCSDCGGWTDFSPTYPPQDLVKFADMIRAMGTAIGNAAAHEMGHQLEQVKNIQSNNNNGLPYMDCGLGNPGGLGTDQPVPIPCETNNGVIDDFVYGFYTADGFPQDPANSHSTGGMFFYGLPGGTQGIPPQSAIHWGPSDIRWLQNYAAPRSSSK